MNITEDFCSYEVAKLLKEKGFDGLCYCHEFTDYEGNFTTYHTEYPENWNQSEPCVSIPTLGMAMKWLREIYHLEINITFGFPFIDGKQQYKYFWSIVRVCDNHLEYPMDDPNSAFYNEEMADSFEEAVEAALKYCLENLI
jgi:hypothetical protein